MSAIAELAADRVVEGVYAVARKQRLRTRGGASYLALELVDRAAASRRVWTDVDLLDSRFAEGDAVHVLGRVERFRDRLQLKIRWLEAAPGADAAALAPAMRRDADELDGFLEFLGAEIFGTKCEVFEKRTMEKQGSSVYRHNVTHAPAWFEPGVDDTPALVSPVSITVSERTPAEIDEGLGQPFRRSTDGSVQLSTWNARKSMLVISFQPVEPSMLFTKETPLCSGRRRPRVWR